ncbi:hypothetical protein FACS1894132_08870 [Clostridia bacterium]|nr:hypothetical protein FACS1894132_08870 [Clostridia bacterium]
MCNRVSRYKTCRENVDIWYVSRKNSKTWLNKQLYLTNSQNAKTSREVKQTI